MAYDGAYMFMMVLICQPVLLLCFFSWFVLLDEDGFLFCSCIFWLSLFLWVCSCRMLQRSKRSGLRCCTPNGKIQTPEEPRQKEQDRDKGHVQIIANRILVYQCICVCVCVCPSFFALPWASGTWLKQTVFGQKMYHPVQDWHSDPSQNYHNPTAPGGFFFRAAGALGLRVKRLCLQNQLGRVGQICLNWKMLQPLNPDYYRLDTEDTPFLSKNLLLWHCQPRFLSNGTGLTKQLSVRMSAIQIVENQSGYSTLQNKQFLCFPSTCLLYIHVLIFSLNIGLTNNDTYGICSCKIRLHSTVHIL